MNLNRQNVLAAMELLQIRNGKTRMLKEADSNPDVNEQLALSLSVYLDRDEYHHGDIEEAIDCLILAGYEIDANSHVRELDGEYEVRMRFPRYNSLKLYGPLDNEPREITYRIEEFTDINKYIRDSKVRLKNGELVKNKKIAA